MDLMQAEVFTDQIISVVLERITQQQLPQIANSTTLAIWETRI